MKRILLILMILYVTSCSRKREPYYIFHIGRDIIAADSGGKVIRDTFYTRINLGYSYEAVNGRDTVVIPKYVTTMDLSRGVKVKMFSGLIAINPNNLELLMNFSPKRLTYMKSNFRLLPEEFVKIAEVKDGYVVFTSMNIYHIDFEGNEKKMIEVYTSKKYYGFVIEKVQRISPEKFIIIGENKFGIYNVLDNSLIINKPSRPVAFVLPLNNKIYSLEAKAYGPSKANYILCEYDYNGQLLDSIVMPVFNNQYRLKPYLINGNLYIMSEKVLYRLRNEDFQVVKKLTLPLEYDSLWSIGSGFLVYSNKKKQIAKIEGNLLNWVVIARDINCKEIYVSSSIISCIDGDSTYVYDLSFVPIMTLSNVLFVKNDFIGTRIKDTLIVYRRSDTFLKTVSPYYSYQRRLREEEFKKNK